MAMNTDIRFRVNPKLRSRAERVVKLRSAGKVNPETLSTFGREGFFNWLVKAEIELGIEPKKEAA